MIPSPSYVLEMTKLRKNLELMKSVAQGADVHIILALKAFSFYSVFPYIKQYLDGATASSLFEARLINEEMGVKAHTYSVAYIPSEFEEIMALSSHLVFNSIGQYERFRPQIKSYNEPISCGIRFNPEYSTVETDLYNPAAAGSRLGETIEAFSDELPEGIEGLHFHTLCESSSFDLEKTLEAVEEKFGHFLPRIKWLNMGGGHLMTRDDYDTDHLVDLLKKFKAKYNLEIILEPGSAVAWQTGFLESTILDVHESKGIKTAILDVSFTAHMPDTLEMPYRPKIRGASDPVEGKPTYRIGGVSCLSGDFMTEYSFENELQIGDRLILEDMMHYTTVKTTMFNGVKHPNICIWRENEILEIVREYTYEDYLRRMG
jgi:carboxynorspermidine decarboxylase